MRIAAIAIVALCMAAPVAAEEILYCADTDATGFFWDKQGKAKRTRFTPMQFTVKVISETKRSIFLQEGIVVTPYTCSKENTGLHWPPGALTVDSPQ